MENRVLGNLVFIFAAAGKWRGSHDHPVGDPVTQSYREDWPWSPELLDEAALRLSAWRGAFSGPLGPRPRAVEELTFALSDDLDTPRALAAVDAWAQEQRLRGR